VNGKNIRITHIGTGNFHEKTARIYSDISLITTHAAIGKEIRGLFDFFESNYLRPQFRHLMVSPFNSRRKLMEGIQGEIEKVKSGNKGYIVIKVNNILDDTLVKKLLEAGESGVKVNLIVRGVCLVIPKTERQKRNIRMISILGRYLEHARLFVFGKGSEAKVWMGSADWMVRNLDYRIEVMIPIYDGNVKAMMMDWINLQLDEKARARNLDPERINEFIYPSQSEDLMDVQSTWRLKLEKWSSVSKFSKK
jgi:polyphosphate kinase